MKTHQRYSSSKFGLHVALSSAALATMTDAASDPERETGGILIGRYGPDGGDALVDIATTPPGDSEGGFDWFERGKDGLAEILEEAWNDSIRRYYVGEWHFHPSGRGTPSSQDIEQMRTFATDERYHCAQPIMIIISPRSRGRIVPRVFVLRMGDCVELFGQE